MSREEINQKLAILPELPGCYIMRNKDKDIIYIGKAKNLRSRVKSFFHSKHEGKTALLVADIDHFEIIVTKTDTESLLLEINLIKQGLTLGDVVKMQVFLVADENKENKMDFAGFMEGYTQFFGTKEQPITPARSAFEISKLAFPGMLVEIEVTAAK